MTMRDGHRNTQRGRVVFGVHPVAEVLRRRPKDVETLLVAKRLDLRIRDLLRDAEVAAVKVQTVSDAELAALCPGHHQGVAALLGGFAYVDLEDLIATSLRPALFLAIDCITDPQNLGAMIRSALVLGATGAILTRDRCAGITSTVVRVSSGASEHLRCAQVTNLVRAIERLRDAGVWVAGTVEQGGMDPATVDLTQPVALVMGSEHKGLRRLVRKSCDYQLTIPAAGAIGALNVAAATTAIFYEAARQRRLAGTAPNSSSFDS